MGWEGKRIHSYFILLEIIIWSIKTVILDQGMLELACTGLINFQKFCKPDDIKLVV